MNIFDPREESFEKWWNEIGKIPSGCMDIVNRERALIGYNSGIEWFKENIPKIIKDHINEENLRKPFIDKRSDKDLEDVVNKIKFEEGFLMGIRDSIKNK